MRFEGNNNVTRGVFLAAFSSGATVQPRSLIYGYTRRPSVLGLGGVHALLDIGCQAVEGLLDVDVVLGRDLQERNAQFVGQLLALLSRDGPLLLPVTLVPDKDLVNTLAGVLLDV